MPPKSRGPAQPPARSEAPPGPHLGAETPARAPGFGLRNPAHHRALSVEAAGAPGTLRPGRSCVAALRKAGLVQGGLRGVSLRPREAYAPCERAQRSHGHRGRQPETRAQPVMLLAPTAHVTRTPRAHLGEALSLGGLQ